MIINHNIADDLKPGTSNGSTGQKRPLEVLRPHSANGIPINKESNSNTSSTAAGRVNTRGANSSESSLQVVANERLSSVSVTCSSGHYFCWYCLNEGHQPASCKHWAQWFQKIDEVKPNQVGSFFWLNCLTELKCQWCRYNNSWIYFEWIKYTRNQTLHFSEKGSRFQKQGKLFEARFCNMWEWIRFWNFSIFASL